MPQSHKGAGEPAGSESAPQSPQFTGSKQTPASSSLARPECQRDSDEWLSLDATEPFPDDLFRIPICDSVFAAMPAWSDAALQSLLALLHLSFRFDPAEGTWVCPDRSFSRRDIQTVADLSPQGTRDGLAELEAEGWIATERTGRDHQHRLLLKVPDRRYTYVPTALLESMDALGSATELRIVLAVLRGTWGWTQTQADEHGRPQTVHNRWTQMSTAALAEATGRSTAAVKSAAKTIQGRWIERVRPGRQAYQYRFVPAAIGDGSGDPTSVSEPVSAPVSGDTAHESPPDRTRSDPSSSIKENFYHKHPRRAEESDDAGTEGSARRNDAVPRDEIRAQHGQRHRPGRRSSRSSRHPPPDFDALSPEQRTLAQKLSNVGVWLRVIPRLIRRYSPERIRANFQLFRTRSSKDSIARPGAWLYAAITQGYALPISGDDDPSSDEATLPALTHKAMVSEDDKNTYVGRGIAEERFRRCLGGENRDPRVNWFMYFDPDTES